MNNWDWMKWVVQQSFVLASCALVAFFVMTGFMFWGEFFDMSPVIRVVLGILLFVMTGYELYVHFVMLEEMKDGRLVRCEVKK